MAENIKSLAAKMERTNANIRLLAGVQHDIIKLMMQDSTIPAMVAHRAKWKGLIAQLDELYNVSGDTNQEDEDGD